MKIKLALFLFIAALSLAACDPQNNLLSNTSQTISSGTWRITLFTDSGNDETSDFTGFTFTFSDSGSVNAVKNGVTKNGTWSVNNSSGKFNIDLGPKVDSNKPLGELTDDWKIISTTDTEIKLTDDNPSSNEFLTFTKN